MNALLEVDDVTVDYGGVHANDAVNLTVGEGQFVGLIGANGAGKTTLVDAVTGFTRLTGGTVRLDGVDVSRESPDRRSRRGLTRTFQSLELFEDLTVMDNMLVACEEASWWTLPRDLFRTGPTAAVKETVSWAMSVAGIEDLANRLPHHLSNGQRKLVALARALASRPRLLMLDEPASGLDSEESKELGTVFRGLLDHGISIFLVEHDMGLVLSVCDEIHVLDFGRLIASGTPAQIRHDPKVIAAYLGTSAGHTSLEGAS